MNNRSLKTNDVVIYNDKQYNVKLNGNRVYMRSDEPQFTIERSVAEALVRVEPANASPELARPVKKNNVIAAQPATVVVAPAREVAAKPVDDKIEKLRALLQSRTQLPASELAKLVNDVCDVFVNKNTLGGVYMIRITEVAGKPIKFFFRGKETNDFVMIKFGKADSFTTRFSQFSFKFTEVLRVDGDTTMEAELKNMFPCNWKPCFYDYGVRKQTILKWIGIPGNNAPTEWRILSRKTYEEILAKAAKVNSLNWQKELHCTKKLLLDEKQLEIEVGSDKRRINNKLLEIL